jgi:hypothetical protein
MLVSPTQTDFTAIDEGFITLSVEARLVNGELLVESQIDESDKLEASVAAEFTPNEEFILSDGSDYDNDIGSGASGYFIVTITGYWKTGDDFYWAEKHYSAFTLTWGHTYSDLVVEHNSEDYDYERSTTGTNWYYSQVSQFAQTKMDMTIYYLGFEIGDVSLDCLVYPTQH